jgi:hypothetical protein
MSTKTTLKRIALVAVSALGFGLMSVMPANAGNGNVTAAFLGRLSTTVDVDGNSLSTYGATSINSTATLATDAPGVSRTTGFASNATSASFVALTVPQGSRVVFAITSVDGTQSFGTDDVHTLIVNGQTVKAVAGTVAAENTLTYDVSSVATVGTYSASIVSTIGTRVITNNFTFVIATKASSSRSVSAANSSISVVRYSDESQCTTATSSIWSTRMATYGITTGYAYGGAAAGDVTNYLVCLNIRSGDDTPVTPDSVFLSTGKGFVNNSHDASEGTASGATLTPASGMVKADLIGDSIQEGATTITAVITYNSGAITLTTPFTWYGDLASLTLTNVSFAQSISASTVAGNNHLFVTAKDDQGNVIPWNAWSDSAGTGLVQTGLTSGGATDLRVKSTKGTGATVTTRNQSDAYATVSYAGQRDLATDTASTAFGAIDIDCATSRAESIDVTIYGYNVLTLAQDIASNTVTYVCSSATAASVTVTPATTAVAAGGTTTVQVMVKDANDLIVPDGTPVSLATGNGNAVTGGSTSTTAGALFTAATFVGSTDDNSAIVTAAAGAVTGNASIKVGTGVSKANASAEAAADAAAEAIDAANAATDAANLAAEAADAATVAAEEARDAADAATAAVEELATQVATLMAALKAQITTLANTVAKIAKKVKA